MISNTRLAHRTQPLPTGARLPEGVPVESYPAVPGRSTIRYRVYTTDRVYTILHREGWNQTQPDALLKECIAEVDPAGQVIAGDIVTQLARPDCKTALEDALALAADRVDEQAKAVAG